MVTQAEHLESSRVREDGTVPSHEPMQTAHLGHKLSPGSHREVVQVCEQNLRSQFLELGGQQTLDRRLGADGHEDGRGNVSVGRMEHAGTRARLWILRDDFVREPLLRHI